MIIYIFKVILCSAFFYSIYKLLLESEQIYHFNRYYLLISICLSFYFPSITLGTSTEIVTPTIEKMISIKNLPISNLTKAETNTNDTHIEYTTVLMIIYFIVTILAISRFIINIYKIYNQQQCHPKISYKGAEIITLQNDTGPYSFFNFIFLNQEDYKNGSIENEILLHELTHVRQKHSYDILFIEFLIALFWFNPILILYRKSIQLNHEFLADEAVIKKYSNPVNYQKLLLAKASRKISNTLTSNLNFTITKKRLTMMTKAKSIKRVIFKQIALIPMLIASLFIFSTNVVAQNSSSISTKNDTAVLKDGVSKELMDEYQKTVRKHVIKNSEKKKPYTHYSDFSLEEISRLEAIYLKMNKSQQLEQAVIFVLRGKPLPKVSPTLKQLEAWKDSKIYGIWLDGKRITNAELSQYTSTDFSQVFVSKLSKNAINYGKHYYQVDLMSNNYYNEYYSKAIAKTNDYFIAFRNVGNDQVFF